MLLLLRRVLMTGLAGFAVAAAQPKIDAKTQELTRKLAGQFEAAQTGEVDLEVIVKVARPETNSLPAKYSLAVEKPNRLALILKEGMIGASVFSDGTNATTFIPMLNKYATRPAPKTVGAMVLEAGANFGDVTGSMAFIAALFSPKPYEALIEGVSEGNYAGAEFIAGREYQRLNFKQEGVGWSMLLTAGEKPLLHRIEVDVSKLPVNAESMTMQFSGWRFNEKIEPGRFRFAAPQGAQKVDALLDADSDLVGEKMPGIKLTSVDGKTWDSSAWKGQAVVLNFWAGEQKHCVEALKDLTDLALDHKAAKFLSVNLDETANAEKVKALFSANRISVPVALDSAHVASEELEVDGVPMTFFINKEGVIQNAWLGHHPDFKKLIAREILGAQK